MSNVDNNIFGIVLGIDANSLEIPKELRDFLELDNQGIQGLDFMLSNPKLSSRIPPDVRIQYEYLYGTINLKLDDIMEKLEEVVNKIQKNPKEVIHALIDTAISKKTE